MIDEAPPPSYLDATSVPKPAWENTEVPLSSEPPPINPFEPSGEVAVNLEKRGPSIFQMVAVIVLIIVVITVGIIIVQKKGLLNGGVGVKASPTNVPTNERGITLTPTSIPTFTPIPTPTIASDELDAIERDLNAIDVKSLN